MIGQHRIGGAGMLFQLFDRLLQRSDALFQLRIILGLGHDSVPVGGNPPVVACYPQGEPPAMSMMSIPHTHEVRYRELSYAQKRAIREQLEASFDWDDGRYIDGSSDHSIASDVGVPWSLIRYVRERDYGHLAP